MQLCLLIFLTLDLGTKSRHGFLWKRPLRGQKNINLSKIVMVKKTIGVWGAVTNLQPR